MAQTDPEAESTTRSGGFLAGLRAGFTSIFQIVLFGTFISIGALAHDLGFSAPWVTLSTVLVWAAPAQVILISSLGAGGAPLAVAIAVSLSAIRLLPMVVSLLPILRSGRRQTAAILLAAHFTAVSMWLESLRLAPTRPREERLAFANGIGTSFVVTSVFATMLGHVLAANLPKGVVAALLFLTPMSFLTSLTRNSRLLSDRVAFLAGLVLGPVLTFYNVGLDLLWTGLIGGTVAYLVHRLWARRR
ncbi:MAG: AzlC family ABC transporter permease [Xanthobacteraceae bacterium]